MSYDGVVASGAMPFTVAVVLGLISIVSPCPLTTNISALGYISKDIGNGRKMILNGILYVTGRVVTYTILGAIAIYVINRGMSVDGINDFINKYGDKILPPILLLMALLILKPSFFHKHKGENCSCHQKKRYSGNIGAFVMGLVFALAFCPINGVFFFGILAPVSSGAGAVGYLLPLVYGLITGIPVLIILYIIKFGIGKVDTFKHNIVKIEKWVRYIVAALLLVFAAYMYHHSLTCGEHSHDHTHCEHCNH